MTESAPTAAVKKVELVAVLGQSASLSHTFWWSELYFTTTLFLSRKLTGLRAETLLTAPFNAVLSAHFWVTAGVKTIVLTALSSSVRKRNYTEKWNGSACRQKLDKCCLCVCKYVCACRYVCEWLYVFKWTFCSNQCAFLTSSVLVRKYADLVEPAP